MSCFNDRRRKEMTKTFEHILVPYNVATGSEKAFRRIPAKLDSLIFLKLFFGKDEN